MPKLHNGAGGVYKKWDEWIEFTNEKVYSLYFCMSVVMSVLLPSFFFVLKFLYRRNLKYKVQTDKINFVYTNQFS